MKKLVFLSMFLFFSHAYSDGGATDSHAYSDGGATESIIKYVQANVHHNNKGVEGIVVLKFTTPADTPPQCGSLDRRMVFSLATIGGRAAFELALSAHDSGRTVAAFGTGRCDLVPYLETLSFIRGL